MWYCSTQYCHREHSRSWNEDGYFHRCREPMKVAIYIWRWLVVCLGSKKRSLLHNIKGNFALSIARNLPVGLQITRGTRILLRPDILCAMLSHPVSHVFLTLKLNSLRRASFEVHESHYKLIFQMLLCGECCKALFETPCIIFHSLFLQFFWSYAPTPRLLILTKQQMLIGLLRV
jgi:hypothetical protein